MAETLQLEPAAVASQIQMLVEAGIVIEVGGSPRHQMFLAPAILGFLRNGDEGA